MRAFPLALLPALFLAACVTGPAQEKKSTADYLNGKHYQHTDTTMGVPQIKRKIVLTEVSGQVAMQNPLLPLPSKLTITVYDGNKALAEAPVQNSGDFHLLADLPKGRYDLRVNAKKYLGELNFSADSYEIKDLRLLLEERR